MRTAELIHPADPTTKPARAVRVSGPIQHPKFEGMEAVIGLGGAPDTTDRKPSIAISTKRTRSSDSSTQGPVMKRPKREQPELVVPPQPQVLISAPVSRAASVQNNKRSAGPFARSAPTSNSASDRDPVAFLASNHVGASSSSSSSISSITTSTMLSTTRQDSPASSSSLSSCVNYPSSAKQSVAGDGDDDDDSDDTEAMTDRDASGSPDIDHRLNGNVSDSDSLSESEHIGPSISLEIPVSATSRKRSRSPTPLARTGTQIQDKLCSSRSFAKMPRCVACANAKLAEAESVLVTTTKTECLFVGNRVFSVLEGGSLDRDPQSFTFVDHSNKVPELDFPNDFNEPFTQEHAIDIKSITAKFLLPTLKKELAHSNRKDARGVTLDVSVRVTCDTCGTSVFSGSWFCRRCGQEICLACHDTLSNELAMRDLSQADRDRRRRCTRAQHAEADFLPIIRWPKDYLATVIDQMEQHSKTHKDRETLQPLSDDEVEQYRFTEESEKTAWPYVCIPPQLLLPLDMQSDAVNKDDQNPPAAQDSLEDFEKYLYSDVSQCAKPGTPPHNSSFPQPWTTEQQRNEWFRRLWARGEPVVVDFRGIDRTRLPWDPKMFVEMCGQERCNVIQNTPRLRRDGGLNPQIVEHTNVGQFFGSFGNLGANDVSYKIKDWPDSAAFHERYPEFFEDFANMLPFPSLTHLQGVLNIAAHTPKAANPADLGPKGYFSECSDDLGPPATRHPIMAMASNRKRAPGSTKLHMDLADAINFMPWASPNPEGKDGTAAWDIYRAEDSEKIREFLYLTISKVRRWTLAATSSQYDDPIHAQKDFLDAKTRELLLDTMGVKSYRIYQRPGQAVLIPAGCAHQVCNYSACIKVASDFVSLENVHRVEKVTDEFGKMTKEAQRWREDVLQLKYQLWWAWHSACRFDQMAK